MPRCSGQSTSLAELLIGGDCEEHVARLHRDLIFAKAVVLEDPDMVERALDKRLGARYTSEASGATNPRITFVGGSTKLAGTAAQFTIEAVDGGGNRDVTTPRRSPLPAKWQRARVQHLSPI